MDFRKGVENGLLMHFSGTHVDEPYGFNITGRFLEDCYAGEYREEVCNLCCRQTYFQKKVGYTRREDYFDADDAQKRRAFETLLFPCSQDDDQIDFGIGMTDYSFPREKIEPVFGVL